MDCDEFVELVTAFLDDALDEHTERRFIAHLAECDGCEIYLDQMRATISEVGSLHMVDLSDGARSSLLAAFRDWNTRP
ncbi:anti-sigma factor [Nocardia mangyaensis]|uniref:Anti-sigma factor n=1 Tax=Nocardia mangyaensis TaxID=2213200 RepID=A0A1J0VWA6_9NOCA|nr:zf-HC2 domain-containing protein [Nocardia mangyaensis]APE36289.1 anti-sigma factor [Nocardia mangyaensis]